MDSDHKGHETPNEFVDASTQNGGIGVSPELKKIEVFAAQVAGHKKSGTGIMKQGDRLLKPLIAREFMFYESLKHWSRVPTFFPQYFGHTQVQSNPTGSALSNDYTQHTLVNDFLILEDLTRGFKKPCICDLKIGRRTTEEDASLFKRMQMKTVDTLSTSSQLGFRICGMRVYNAALEEYIVKDKIWGALLASNNMRDALRYFVNNGREIRYDVLLGFIPQLDEVLNWFKTENRMMRFVGSSILLIYDAEQINTLAPSEHHNGCISSRFPSCAESNSHKMRPLRPPSEAIVRVGLIDFAHTCSLQEDQIDANYIFGAENVRNILSELCSEKKEKQFLEEL